MLDDAGFDLNSDQNKFENETLLYLQLNQVTRERDRFRDLLNEATLVYQGLIPKEKWIIKTLKALAGDL